jgi:hypothetical protein
MRTIKFRAKRLDNGKWAYGGLVEANDYCIIDQGNELYVEEDYNFRGDTHFFRLSGVMCDENTIGQFTGLKDSNGKEIYEGDVVRFDDSPYNPYATPYTGKIVFYKGYWSVEIVQYGNLVHPHLFRDDFADKKTTILGNVHDTPELLNTK